ncbi:MAG: insulinase family protein [Rickettsiales bacterium]|nr:insulinase family protein [Rickettsiales bacterium]
MSYQLRTLPNGLRVATERLEGVATITAMVTVDTGSRDEQAGEYGISHLLEHMAFKGTATMNARQLAEAFDDIGGQNNAYTSADQTVYYAKVMAQDGPLALGILGDILTHSTIDAIELERERGVILQEIAMHADMPEERVGEWFQEAAFQNQPLGRSILGTAESVSAMTRTQVLEYMRRGYGPRHMVLTIVGDLSHDTMVEAASQHFSNLPEATGPLRTPAIYTGGERREEGDFEQAHLMFGLCGLSYEDDDYYALQLMNTILCGGISSRLFQEVREIRGLAYNIQSFAYSFDDIGTFGIYAATAPHQVPELVPVVAEQLLSLTHRVSEEELHRAQKQHIAGLAMARESTSSVAEWIGRQLLAHNEYRAITQLTQQIEAITVADIQRVTQRLLSMGPLSVGALGPISQLEPYDAIQQRFAV